MASADQVRTLNQKSGRKRKSTNMKIRTNSLVLTAAFAGLLSGTMTRLSAASGASSNSNAAMSFLSQFAGQFAGTAKDDKKGDKKAEKDKNSCKGKGGCGSDSDSSKNDTSKKGKK
jgi:hypothetical protein